VARQESDWRLVEASSSINIDCVGDVFRRLGLVDCGMKRFILPCRSEEQASVWSKRQPPKERCKSFIEVDRSIADSERAETVQARRIWHHCGQGHRRSWRSRSTHRWRGAE
jgi:hypothetical protein